MAKKNSNKEMNRGCGCCCNFSEKGAALTLILIGIAYALQNSGILFANVVLWPWVLIALGICVYLLKKK